MRWRGVGRIAIRRRQRGRALLLLPGEAELHDRLAVDVHAHPWQTRARRNTRRDTRSASPEPIDEVLVHARCGRRLRRRNNAVTSPARSPRRSSPPSTRLRTRQPSPGSSASRDGDWAPWPRQCPAATRRASGSGRSPPSAGPLSTPPARAAHARSAIFLCHCRVRSLARSLARAVPKELETFYCNLDCNLDVSAKHNGTSRMPALSRAHRARGRQSPRLARHTRRTFV